MDKPTVKTISIEGAVCLIVALINLALDQADIRVMLISWLSVVACIVLCFDILRRTKWIDHPEHGKVRTMIGSGLILVAFFGFGLFLSFHKKAIAEPQETKVVKSIPGVAPTPSPKETSTTAKTTPDPKGARADAPRPGRSKGTENDGSANKSIPTPLADVTNNCQKGICISGGTVNGNPTVNNFGGPLPPPIPTIKLCVSELPVSSDGIHAMQLLLDTSEPVMEAWIALFFDGPVLDGSAMSDPGSFGYTHNRADKLPEPEKSFLLKVTSIDFGLPRWVPGRTIKITIPSKQTVKLTKVLTGSGDAGLGRVHTIKQ